MLLLCEYEQLHVERYESMSLYLIILWDAECALKARKISCAFTSFCKDVKAISWFDGGCIML
jgi:hypothetical protein